MEFLANIVTTSQLVLTVFILVILMILLLIYIAILIKKTTHFSKQLFQIERSLDHKHTILETTVARLAQDLPIDQHPHTHDKHLTQTVEQLLHQFSVRLNQKLNDKLQQEQEVWHDKFSILLTTLGKTEKELRQNRDDLFKESWTSITELRQKSQLLFNDMKEDGMFFRLQSLWLLSNLNIEKELFYEAFRHCTAALRLYNDSKPKLPLSHKILWNIGTSFVDSGEKLNRHQQQEIFKKFHLSSQQIIELYQELENFESNVEVLQKIRLWHNQFTKV